MNRRAFLKLFASAAPAVVAPTYFFAPVGCWTSDVIGNPLNAMQAGVCVVGHRIYYLGKNGIYENGTLISRPTNPELWFPAGAPAMSMQQRLNSVCQLMDSYARRSGAEWTNKPWS